MLRLSCKDIGGRGDKFVATGRKVSSVKKQMWAHAAKKHKAMLKKMTPSKMKAMDKMMSRAIAKNKKADKKKKAHKKRRR